MAGLGEFDIVYSWGVLHHTGLMWRGIDLAARAVRPGGLLFIAIYNDQWPQSRLWHWVNKRYNRSGTLGRLAIVTGSAAYFNSQRWAAGLVRRFGSSQQSRPNPQVLARGMSRRHDLLDWVGGYPFEVAKPEQIFSYLHERGFELRHLTTCGGRLGCNEYVLERR